MPVYGTCKVCRSETLDYCCPSCDGDRIEELENMVRWREISTDGLPTEDAQYIIFAPSADPDHPLKTIAWFTPGFGWSLLTDEFIQALTHWMPMPQNP